MSNAPVSQDEIERIKDVEFSWRLNCGPFGHVSQSQAEQAFMDIGYLLRLIAERDALHIDDHRRINDMRYELRDAREDLANYRTSAEEQIAELSRRLSSRLTEGQYWDEIARINGQHATEVSKLREQLDSIKRSREQEQAYDSMCYELQQARAEIAQIRAPSDAKEISAIIQRSEDRNKPGCFAQPLWSEVETLLHALAESQRECARLQREISLGSNQ